MSGAAPGEPVNKDVVIYSLTTAVATLKAQLDAAATENQEQARLLTEAEETISSLQRDLAAKDGELVAGLARERQSSENRAREQKWISDLEWFLETIGLEVQKIKAEGLWGVTAARLLKAVYDPSRETAGTTDVLRHVAQSLIVDHRPPHAD